MNNKDLSAETKADSSIEADVTTSSQTIANAPVGSSLDLECPGAGILRIGTSAHLRCGGRMGFNIGVSWGRHGFTGGILPRREAEKLIKMLYEQLKDITESEEDEYARLEKEMDQYFKRLK